MKKVVIDIELYPFSLYLDIWSPLKRAGVSKISLCYKMWKYYSFGSVLFIVWLRRLIHMSESFFQVFFKSCINFDGWFWYAVLSTFCNKGMRLLKVVVAPLSILHSLTVWGREILRGHGFLN